MYLHYINFVLTYIIYNLCDLFLSQCRIPLICLDDDCSIWQILSIGCRSSRLSLYIGSRSPKSRNEAASACNMAPKNGAKIELITHITNKCRKSCTRFKCEHSVNPRSDADDDEGDKLDDENVDKIGGNILKNILIGSTIM